MRYAFIGLCIVTAACSGQPFSPTSPSGVGGGVGALAQASGGAPVEVTFTKWVTTFPALAGVTGGDVAGTLGGDVLSRDPFDNGVIVQLEAQYAITGTNPAHSFVAHIEGKQNNETHEAVLNGTVISGWLSGAQVHVTYLVIPAAAGVSCVAGAPVNRTCFQGTIRILPGSAN
jgi:hypothetical protein